MAFEFFVLCDGDDCNSRLQVKEPGQLPLGWVALQYIKPNVSITRPNNGMPQAMNMNIQKLFCGMKCANKYTKNFIQEKANG